MSGVLTLPEAGSTRAILGEASPSGGLRPEDARIAALVHAGQHRRAVELAARVFGPDLHRFFARWNQDEAEDLVQEVLVRVYEAFRRGQFVSQAAGFGGWVFKIATNARRDHYRKHRRRGDLIAENAGFILRDLHGAAQGRASWESLGPLEQRCWLRAALASLPDEDQELLALRYDAGLPWTEVARTLGLRMSTAKLRFTQIRAVLLARWRR